MSDYFKDTIESQRARIDKLDAALFAKAWECGTLAARVQILAEQNAALTAKADRLNSEVLFLRELLRIESLKGETP